MTIITEKDVNEIRVISINTSNEFSPANLNLHQELKSSLERASRENTIKIIIMTGVENAFNVGNNLTEVKSLLSNNVDVWIDSIIGLYTQILEYNKPTIIAVNGYVVGIGFQFAILFDYCIASKNSKFYMPELKSGISCIIGSTILEAIVGYQKAKRIIYNCNILSTTQAQKLDLIDQVVEQNELEKSAICKSNIIAKYPVSSFVNTKAVMVKKLRNSLKEIAVISKELHKKYEINS